ncbi:hypothetical protein HMPREF3196_01979 [Bifidobacterium bifidum]|uniref:Uncharacterized protein n=1 Tax=Bifidobacterium bifidum TaxID=1681 RepID=A0A133KKU4_BIFBI|nr:hypothetical protein HMPREF3196_01979 [Bifidobacterium bifidum]
MVQTLRCRVRRMTHKSPDGAICRHDKLMSTLSCHIVRRLLA